ncbi:C1 family peptidase [Pontibacter sp. G13]|uniref:aminopeptidase C n=1 Tax=Pontibacter sp. G13 TaxID=3074898 RepID=UPI002889BF5F|nr:C1 family peptidase [Pontibacter sp. G13]WNJ19402.1 C1 family peptidase [Pontibacter sp. G13]
MKRIILNVGLCLLFPALVTAQEVRKNRPDGGYLFTIDHDIAATEVKSQDRSGTCWSYSTVSFLESELIRTGKGSHDLSEMFVVRNTYPKKVELYLRMQGNSRLSAGGTFHDVLNVLRTDGIVPQEAFSGLADGEQSHNHAELDALMETMAKTWVDNPAGKLSTKWKPALEGVLDAYLGQDITEFEYQGKSYSPQSFAEELELDADEFIEFTSFIHQPFYEKNLLEIPDNWDYHQMYNLPLEELVEVMDYALSNGFTVAWDADVSEKTFSHKNGVAVMPATPYRKLSADERKALFNEPQPELEVTPENRQAAFDDYTTTDDHLMHITGMAHDQNGTPYYLVKNSWGDSNACGGYLYVSLPYVQAKTIHILIHKDAVPKEIMKKLK